MGEKYHINNHGVPALCHAKSGNCPLERSGELREHYDTEEEAQDAVDDYYERKHGIISTIEGSNVGDDKEIEQLAKKVIKDAEEKGIDTDEEREYVERIKDSMFVSRVKNPKQLQSEFGVDTNKFNENFGKRLVRNTEIISDVLSEVDSIERKYNNEMEDYLDIEREESISKKRGISSEASISGKPASEQGSLRKIASAPIHFITNRISGEVKTTGERERVTTETQKLKMSKEHLEENEMIRADRERLEEEKEREISSLNGKLLEISRSKRYFRERALNKHIRGKAKLIRNPDNRRQALAYLDEKDDLLFKTYVSESDMMSIRYKFKEAYEEKDEVKMRSCNRIVNMLGANNRDADTYFNKGVNEGTFESNYERLKSGSLIYVMPEDINERVKNLDEKTYNCFDT